MILVLLVYYVAILKLNIIQQFPFLGSLYNLGDSSSPLFDATFTPGCCFGDPILANNRISYIHILYHISYILGARQMPTRDTGQQ